MSTDVGFVDEVVLDGKTGRLAPRGDVVRLAAGVEEALVNTKPWGVNAREHCRATFSSDVVVPQWEDFIAAVATRRSRRA